MHGPGRRPSRAASRPPQGDGKTEGCRPLRPEMLMLTPVGIACARGQIPAGAIDVEDQHRQRRAVGLRFAPVAFLRRALERSGDALGVFPGEDAAFQIERTAFARDTAGPGAGRIAPCRLCAPRLSLRRFTPARLPGCRVAAHGLSAGRGASHAVLPTCGPPDLRSSRRAVLSTLLQQNRQTAAVVPCGWAAPQRAFSTLEVATVPSESNTATPIIGSIGVSHGLCSSVRLVSA